MEIIICAIFGIIIGYIIYYFMNSNKEGFNDQTGQFCQTCRGKTLNQCLSCFNCGFCVDRWGNSGCIGGDHKGPYNFERCYKWYHTDPWAHALNRNAKYGCQFGIKSSNKLVRI